MAVFLVLCPFKAWGMEEDLREKAKDYYEQPPQNYPIKEKYVRHDLYTVPCPDQNSYFRVQFDVNDNLYFFCGSSILIYDKTGKLARRLDWKPPPGWTEKGLHKINTIFVDEIGNILVLDGDRIYVLNRDKGLVQTGWNDKGSSLWPGYYSLSNGVFYSWQDGRILFVINGYDSGKIKSKIFASAYTGEHGFNGRYQVKVGGKTIFLPHWYGDNKHPGDHYGFNEILAIDDFGNVYAQYSTQTENQKYPDGSEQDFTKRRLYIYDRNFNLLTYFDHMDYQVPNLKTGEFYTGEPVTISGRKVLKLYKWSPEKP